jgi:DNA-binding NtrC family response regulator
MKKRILVADSGARYYSQLLKKLLAKDCQVFHASNIEEAVEHLDVRTADLLLVDLDVPAQKLCTGLFRIGQVNPGLRVIGITERSQGSEVAIRAGLHGVAEKPIAFGNLLAFIHDLLRDSSPWTEFRYLAPSMPGLRQRLYHRRRDVSQHPAVYSGGG